MVGGGPSWLQRVSKVLTTEQHNCSFGQVSLQKFVENNKVGQLVCWHFLGTPVCASGGFRRAGDMPCPLSSGPNVISFETGIYISFSIRFVTWFASFSIVG